MGLSLITASLVMLVMTGFMMVAIKQVATALRRQLKEDVALVLGTYDNLIEEKSVRLAELNEELLAAKPAAQEIPAVHGDGNQETVPFNPVSSLNLVAGVRWRDKNFADAYSAIHDGFQLDYEEIIQEIAREHETAEVFPAQEILDTVSFDTFCSLAMLDGESQVEILRESLPASGAALLEEYRQKTAVFDSADFYSYLKKTAKEQSQNIVIKTGSDLDLEDVPGGVCVTKSKDICEGIQIVAGNTLYDYSISEREIS